MPLRALRRSVSRSATLRQSGWPARETLREILAVDEFHHQCADAVGFLQAVDVRDVRVVERGEDLRFSLEAGEAIGIIRERGRQNLDCDVAIQLGVRARYTSPMPPAPRADWISYGPRHDPGASVIAALARSGGARRRSWRSTPPA